MTIDSVGSKSDTADDEWPWRVVLEPSTTLSDPQLVKPLFGLLHPPHVMRAADKQQPRKDLLYEGPDLRKREPWPLAGPHPFGLEKRVGDGADHHVVLPARIGPSFEVIESELGLEVLVMLFDGPAGMGDRTALPRLQDRARTRSLRRTDLSGLAAPHGDQRRRLRVSPDRTDAAPRGATAHVSAGPGLRTRDLYGAAVYQPPALHAVDEASRTAVSPTADLTKSY